LIKGKKKTGRRKCARGDRQNVVHEKRSKAFNHKANSTSTCGMVQVQWRTRISRHLGPTDQTELGCMKFCLMLILDFVYPLHFQPTSLLVKIDKPSQSHNLIVAWEIPTKRKPFELQIHFVFAIVRQLKKYMDEATESDR
jgi:hypothetical protein